MDHANIKSEPIRQAPSPGIAAHAADTTDIAGNELLNFLHIAPPLRPVQGMIDGLADHLDRRFDMPDSNKAVLHLRFPDLRIE